MSSTTCTEINTTETIDLLGRQKFVDQLLGVAETLSNNKKNACYAVNGAWGTGKTFVMNMFEQQATEIGQAGTTLPRYLLFHYNCWEYDYYDEPLVAILRSLIDNIDEKVKLLNGETKTELREILKAAAGQIGTSLVKLAAEKTGLPLDKVLEILKDGHSAAEKLHDEGFDPYCKLKEVLKEVRAELTKIAEYQTVIVVVDELDRCLPEYAIKVMERLHHLFEGIPNIQVILSVDKLQMEHTVKQIYGAETDVNKYLSKFIQFQIELDVGSFADKERLQTKFNDYFCLFGYHNRETTQHDIEVFCHDIFEDIDIRTRIAIIEKCMMLHELLSKNEEQLDYSFMCMEVFLAILQYHNVYLSYMHGALHNDCVSFVVKKTDDTEINVLSCISKVYSQHKYYEVRHNNDYSTCYIMGKSIWGVVLAVYFLVLGGNKISLEGNFGEYVSYSNNVIEDYVKSFWSLLQIIK